MEEKVLSNYDIMKQNAQHQFMEYDQGKMIEKWQLETDADYMYMTFLSQKHRIRKVDGYVEYRTESGTWTEAKYGAVMTMYDILCYSKEHLHVMGEFVSVPSLSTVHNATSYAGEGMYVRDSKYFDGKNAALSAACEKLNGKKGIKGDVVYEIPVFDEFHIMFQFWDSDDEFPPSIQLYCDKNTLDYMHYETIWYMMGYIIEEIKERM